jgi:hypothetical protein
MHYNKLISCSSNKSKAAWNAIKTLTNKQSNSKEELMLNLEGKLVKNPQTLADIFSRYFSKVVEESVNFAIKLDHNQINKTSMEYLESKYSQPFLPLNPKPVTVKEIYEINKSLKWKNSCGYDQIPNRIVKLSMSFICSPLCYICKTTGVFPARLKYAQVVPVYKRGSKVDITAYRPISLLTSFTKIFEKVIFNLSNPCQKCMAFSSRGRQPTTPRLTV